MYVKTKISQGFQVVVPAEIRKTLGLKPGDFVTWRLADQGVIFEPIKDVTFEDVYGMVDDVETNAVEAKKRIQRGEKY